MAHGGLPPGTGAADALKALLHDRWELYDVKKMRRLKALVIGILVPVLFLMILFLVYTLSRTSGALAIEYQVLIAVAVTLVVALVIVAKLRQMDRVKLGWSFSALQDARLTWEEMLQFCRAFLAERGLSSAEKTRRTTSLFITYFDVPGKDFAMRLWFSKLLTPPVVEIGFGPESPVNRNELRELEAAMSQKFVERFGSPA